MENQMNGRQVASMLHIFQRLAELERFWLGCQTILRLGNHAWGVVGPLTYGFSRYERVVVPSKYQIQAWYGKISFG